MSPLSIRDPVLLYAVPWTYCVVNHQLRDGRLSRDLRNPLSSHAFPAHADLSYHLGGCVTDLSPVLQVPFGTPVLLELVLSYTIQIDLGCI